MENFTLESPSHSELGRPFDQHIPFHAHINQPQYSRKLSLPEKFHPYSRLPPELQLHILQLCDHQTLFRLMQTCSSIRSLAKSLSWSHKAVWYYVSNVDILSSLATHSKSSTSLAQCPIFRKQIQHIELVLGQNSEFFWSQLPGHKKKLFKIHQPCFTQSAAKLFVCESLRLYPSLKRVVIIDQNIEPSLPPPWIDARSVEEASILARAFPPHITVFRSTVLVKLGQPFPYERALYRWNPTLQWLLVESHWTRQRVIPPQVPVTGIVGVIGEYQQQKPRL
jgi:hypothetical protein